MGRFQTFVLGEWRRMQAWQLSQQGWKQRDIATALDVTESAVSQWLMRGRQQGPEALRTHPPPGRVSRLTLTQQRLIPDFLWHGAEAYGFRGEVWTCRRVAQVLQEEFQVTYSLSQVSRLLRRLHWTPQIPLTQAIQRDEVAIEQWRCHVWPGVKQRAQQEHRTLVFIDESGFYLLPGVVRTYAPEGQRPVQPEWQTRDHLSVMGGLTLAGQIYTLARQESLNGLHTVTFLQHLLAMVGNRLLVVWDNSPIHRRQEVKIFLAQGTAGAIHVEPLPPYAPDLNPVEWLWHQLKYVELRNLACLDLEQLHMEWHLALGRIRQNKPITASFFEGAKLNI